MSGRITQRTTIWMLGIVVSGIASGQSADSESLNVDMTQCLNLATEDRRLACYQERVEAALAEREAAATNSAAPPAPAAPPARASVPARNAAPPPAAARPDPAAAALPQQRERPAFNADEYLGTITDLRKTMPNRWVITLDNGQVWQMNQSKRYPLRVGQAVRVVSTRWGDSWRLTAIEHGGFVQVRRAL